MNLRRVSGRGPQGVAARAARFPQPADGAGHADHAADALRLRPDARRGQRAAGRVGPERHGAKPGVHQPLRRLAVLLAHLTIREQLPRISIQAIDTGEVMMGLVVPRDFAQKIEAGRDAAVQLIVDGSDSNTATIAIGYAGRDRANLRAGPDRGAEPAAHGGSRPLTDPAGRAAAGLVQRGARIAELHHSRPDRRDHDGHRGDADLVDRSRGNGSGARWSN